MRTIGIRAFRDAATKHLAGTEPLEIQRHGHTVGYFLPSRDAQGRPPLATLAALLDRAIDESDLTQDELVALLARSRSAR
jgi:hypothetical protein